MTAVADRPDTALPPDLADVDPDALTAIDDPVERARALGQAWRALRDSLAAERARRAAAVLTLTREWDDAYAEHAAAVEAITPAAWVKADHADAVRALRRAKSTGRITPAEFAARVKAEDERLRERLAKPGRLDGLAYAEALDALSERYRARKAAIEWHPSAVGRLIGKSRSLITRMRDRAPAVLPTVEDPVAQARDAAAKVDALVALENALLPVRDATVLDLAEAHPDLSNVAIADLVGLDSGQAVTRIRAGR